MSQDSKPCVRDHIPLEQGLRLNGAANLFHLLYVRDHIPLEQGLRRPPEDTYPPGLSVRDHIPLEQGLRQDCHAKRWHSAAVSETIFH